MWWLIFLKICGNLPWNNPIEEDNSGYPDLIAGEKGLTAWPHFQGLHPIIPFSTLWALRSLQRQQGPLDLVGCCPIVTGCEGVPMTVQASGPQKCMSATVYDIFRSHE